MKVYLLIEGQQTVGVYLDKALADADCWTCNEAQYQKEDGDIADYWVDEMEVMTSEYIAWDGRLVDGTVETA